MGRQSRYFLFLITRKQRTILPGGWIMRIRFEQQLEQLNIELIKMGACVNQPLIRQMKRCSMWIKMKSAWQRFWGLRMKSIRRNGT